MSRENRTMNQNMTADSKTRDTATILTLIRRGASVERISTMLHVNRSEVEEVMDWYVDRMMA